MCTSISRGRRTALPHPSLCLSRLPAARLAQRRQALPLRRRAARSHNKSRSIHGMKEDSRSADVRIAPVSMDKLECSDGRGFYRWHRHSEVGVHSSFSIGNVLVSKRRQGLYRLRHSSINHSAMFIQTRSQTSVAGEKRSSVQARSSGSPMPRDSPLVSPSE